MTMLQLFLLPLFLHVLLVTVVGIRTVLARIVAVKSGKTKIKDIVLSNENWDRQARALGNNFNNQFETPTLWYGAAALIVSLNMADVESAILSWLFLATRLGHSWVHTGSNNIRLRMSLFLAGFSVLFLLWLWFGIHLFVTG